jgi:hypothetical protein
LTIQRGASLRAPALRSVGGELIVRRGGAIEAPDLVRVGGDLVIHGTATLFHSGGIAVPTRRR